MRWFKNLKIKTKLITCFVVLAILTATVGAIGIINMKQINKSAEQMYEENFLTAQSLTKFQKNLQFIRVNFLMMLYEEDLTTFKGRLGEINKWTDEDNKIIEEYEKTITTKEEQDLFDKVTEQLTPYRALRGEFLNFLELENYNDARAMIEEFGAARAAVDDALQKIIDFNVNKAAEKAKQNEVNFNTQSKSMIAFIVAGILLSISFGLIISNLINKPLHKLLLAADKIADGDLNIAVDISTKDEIGNLSKSFEKMTDHLNEIMENINMAAEQVATGSKQVSDSSMALSEGATHQASSVEELTASLEEIASQTKLNADNANQANSLADTAKKNAEQGNEQMREMLKAMEDINEASASISKIIKVIDEIAFQTNILALNAAVEAARAGQHGKGFAVVAEEVRNLAARSANAAKETTDMIEGSIRKVEGGTKIASQTADALNKIVHDITCVANLIGDIAVASNEQSLGIVQINQGIMQVSDVVQTNSATSEESAAASEELSSQAELLKEQVATFKLRSSSNHSTTKAREDVNPEVFRMLDERGKKIKLNDTEFGKY